MPATDPQMQANSSQPNPTMTGKLLPEREAQEVQRRTEVYVAELNPSGELGVFLCRLAAIMSTRIERGQLHEIARLTERVRRAIAEIEYPAVIDPAGAAKLRDEASQRAVFDPSPEATLARKYMAAAERSFFRALKELRTVEREEKRFEAELFGDELGSSVPGDLTDEEFDALCARSATPARMEPPKSTGSDDFAHLRGRVDVPFAIGKRR